MNIQILTEYCMARYVAKYVAKIDKNNLIVFHADNTKTEGEKGGVKMEHVFLSNTKITSSRIHEDKRMKSRRDNKHPVGRLISTFEIEQLLLGYPQIYMSYETCKISTLPKGERASFERTRPIDKEKDLPENDKAKFECNQRKRGEKDLLSEYLPCVSFRDAEFRNQCYRSFSPSQKIVLRDQLEEGVTVDAVTVFGFRPPELRLLVSNPQQYFRWFVRSTKAEVTEIGLVWFSFLEGWDYLVGSAVVLQKEAAGTTSTTV